MGEVSSAVINKNLTQLKHTSSLSYPKTWYGKVLSEYGHPTIIQFIYISLCALQFSSKLYLFFCFCLKLENLPENSPINIVQTPIPITTSVPKRAKSQRKKALAAALATAQEYSEISMEQKKLQV